MNAEWTAIAALGSVEIVRLLVFVWRGLSLRYQRRRDDVDRLSWARQVERDRLVEVGDTAKWGVLQEADLVPAGPEGDFDGGDPCGW